MSRLGKLLGSSKVSITTGEAADESLIPWFGSNRTFALTSLDQGCSDGKTRDDGKAFCRFSQYYLVRVWPPIRFRTNTTAKGSGTKTNNPGRAVRGPAKNGKIARGFLSPQKWLRWIPHAGEDRTLVERSERRTSKNGLVFRTFGIQN